MSCRFQPERFRRFAPCAIAYLVLSAVLVAGTSACRKPDSNLIVNGNLTASNGFFPTGWWPSPQADCAAVNWFHPPGGAGELRISHARLYDAGGWDQLVNLQPGWYRLGAEVRSEDGGASDGALMAVKVGLLSSAVAGLSPNWTPVALYFKLPAAGPVSIQCRLHNSPGHRTKAFFRNLELVKVSAPAPGAASQIDFSKLPQQEWPPEEQKEWNPVFSDWRPAVATVLMVCVTFGAFWFWLNPARLRSLDASSEAAPDRWTRRGVALFFAITLVFMFAMTWMQWIPGVGFRIVRPSAASSDEPYYVLVVNSILFDHDLELQDDYRRVAQGGLEAGKLWAGFAVDHHTLIVNRRTGRHLMGSWQTRDVALSRRHCNPEFDESSPDVYEVSAHPVAWPALIALALAPFHPAIGDVEADAAIFLGLLSFLTAVVTYLIARRDGLSRGWSMTTVAILVGASSWLAYSRSFFPESGIGLAMTLCMWAWMAERPVLAAFPAAIAAALKPPFAVVGAGIIFDEFRCGRRREAIEAAVVLGACALALFAFNYWHAKTFFVGGVGGLHTSTAYTRAMNFLGMVESFVDPLHSVILFVSWTIVAFVAIAREAPYRNAEGRMLRRMALPIALYILILGTFGAYPGLSYGPRYWIAFLPWMALAMVHSIRRADRPAQLACSLLVLIAIVIAIPGALRYPHLLRKPPWVEFYGW